MSSALYQGGSGLGSSSLSSSGGLVNESISRRLVSALERIDPEPDRRTCHAVCVVNPGGFAIHKQQKTSVFNPSGYGDRGVVTGRSRRSRRRLMEKLTRVDLEPVGAQRKDARSVRAAFVTLTYPADFPSWEVAKQHLDAFRKRLHRRFPLWWAVWVEEFQRRGAVHFHLVMVWRDPVDLRKFRPWLSLAWYEVVGSGDVKHLRAGTQAVGVWISDGVGSLMSYLAGELGKVRQTSPADPRTGELIETGRTWGFWYQSEIPFQTLAVVRIETPEAWEALKERVSEVFAASSWLSGVPEYVEWKGALLYGDGWGLLESLVGGLEGIDLRRVV